MLHGSSGDSGDPAEHAPRTDSALGTIARGEVVVELPNGYRSPATRWVISANDASTRKSPTQAVMFRPVHDWLRDWEDIHGSRTRIKRRKYKAMQAQMDKLADKAGKAVISTDAEQLDADKKTMQSHY